MSAAPTVLMGVGFLAMMAGVLIGNLSTASMLERVNKDRMTNTKITPYWWYAGKTWKMISLYRAVEPNGKLFVRVIVAFALLVTGFATAASGLLFSATHS